ncbi:hypothetical protein CIHG_06126 [Coccidioides immitis H538.4]|nr:hypothetical protein CIRG_00066 [Coccidioides immitis RMSCC 2394]KMU75853.1 hypothetical protein CISG_05250 [Coccidioides immitis RMSCC 3703]KMU88328.1 hypothetical protein CIHG_06126 [Coccidioides immitis H538.4]
MITCYTIHSSCDGLRAVIRQAADEAFFMADHAAFRAGLQDPQINNDLVHKLLGNPGGLQAFEMTMKRVKQEVGEHTRTRPYGAAIIKCGDDHMVEVPNRPGHFLDREFLTTMRPTVMPANRRQVCVPGVIAVTYELGRNNPQSAVLLCLNRNGDPVPEENAILEGWNDPLVESESLNLLESYLSVTMLHEFLHAIDPRNFPSDLSPGVAEAYGLSDISMLTTPEKRRNADSYALLAGGLYYRLNPLNEDGEWERPYERGRVPPRGPHPEDDVLDMMNSDDEDDSDIEMHDVKKKLGVPMNSTAGIVMRKTRRKARGLRLR